VASESVDAWVCEGKAILQQNGLREFEQDLHQHIHLENNILFPRAVALESSAN
jgi:iron-sulfur cluster repair protein YtfE (RIC family)